MREDTSMPSSETTTTDSNTNTDSSTSKDTTTTDKDTAETQESAEDSSGDESTSAATSSITKITQGLTIAALALVAHAYWYIRGKICEVILMNWFWIWKLKTSDKQFELVLKMDFEILYLNENGF